MLARDRLLLRSTKALQSSVSSAGPHLARLAKQNRRTSALHSLPPSRARHDSLSPFRERVLHQLVPHPKAICAYRVNAVTGVGMSYPTQIRVSTEFHDNT